jgi:hypothetical protein
MQTAPGVLQKNELSVSKCNDAGKVLIDTIEGIGEINSDELDAEVANYINKVKTTVKNMNERRKPLTQLLQSVSKTFTALESAIDLKTSGSIPSKLQIFRDRYAAKKIREQKEREEEARKVQALENEKASYRADLIVLLENVYTAFVNKSISYLQGLYDRTTLENYNDSFTSLKKEKAEFSWTGYTAGVKDNIVTYYMNAEARTAIKNEVAALKKKEFTERYSYEIDELKLSLLDRMPSKRKALEDESELAKQSAELAAKAEAERKQREQEEAAKAEAERKRQEEAAKVKAEAEKQTSEAQAAFNFMNQVTPDTQVKAKVQKKIKVINPKGFVEVYQLWFMKEGISLSIDELEKVHKKMITFCEKEANRDGGELIKSAFIEYVNNVKAK